MSETELSPQRIQTFQEQIAGYIQQMYPSVRQFVEQHLEGETQIIAKTWEYIIRSFPFRFVKAAQKHPSDIPEILQVLDITREMLLARIQTFPEEVFPSLSIAILETFPTIQDSIEALIPVE